MTESEDRGPRSLWGRFILATILGVVLGACIPGLDAIPPLIESDYCYQLTATDRWLSGRGLTSTIPVAPGQSWEFKADWAFLTKWPPGYPMMIAGVRHLTGVDTLTACRWIGLAAAALALAGWYAWTRSVVPRGVTGELVSVVAGASAVRLDLVVNPSTDGLLLAATPVVLLLARGVAGGQDSRQGGVGFRGRSYGALNAGILGLLTGTLFLLRYASLYVPVAIALVLWLQLIKVRFRDWCQLLAFIGGTTIPILGLTAMNLVLGPAESLSARFNLGEGVRFSLSSGVVVEAWRRWCDLGFYAHRPIVSWFLVIAPLATVVGMCVGPWRLRLRTWRENPSVRLGAATVVGFLLLIVAATSLFSGKFRFVGLDRYYLPVRPLYLGLVLAPWLYGNSWITRGAVAVGMMGFLIWIGQVTWWGSYQRARTEPRLRTPYGAWSRCFEPGAPQLYRWLRGQGDPGTVLFSNFHEYVTLETGIATLPMPGDRQTLGAWLDQVQSVRGVVVRRAYFILNPDNLWRSHWIKPPGETVAALNLTPVTDVPGADSRYVYRCDLEDDAPVADHPHQPGR